MDKKILVVDEEKWYMDALFDRIDCEFGKGMYDYAFNGIQALKKIEKNYYNVVILDLLLPLGDGINLPSDEPDLVYGIYILRKIRNINNDIPVICYTILDDNNVKASVTDLNATYICKINDDSFELLFNKLKSLIKE